MDCPCGSAGRATAVYSRLSLASVVEPALSLPSNLRQPDDSLHLDTEAICTTAPYRRVHDRTIHSMPTRLNLAKHVKGTSSSLCKKKNCTVRKTDSFFFLSFLEYDPDMCVSVCVCARGYVFPLVGLGAVR